MRVIISLFVLSSLSILRASPVNLSHKTPSAAIPIRVDVIITSSDSFLLGVAPFVNLMRLLPGKVSVEVSLAMQKDSTGEYKCFGLNCTELKLPLRTNLTLLKGLVLQKKSQKIFRLKPRRQVSGCLY